MPGDYFKNAIHEIDLQFEVRENHSCQTGGFFFKGCEQLSKVPDVFLKLFFEKNNAK